MALATVDDYAARYGVPDNTAVITKLLADAESLVHQEAQQVIELVTDDVVTLDPDGTAYLGLWERPVVGVSQVRVDGVVIEAAQYQWRRSGSLIRRHGLWRRGTEVEVTYSHGQAVVPPWIVSLVCAASQRAIVAYTPDGAGTNVWLRDDEKARLRMLGPVIA